MNTRRSRFPTSAWLSLAGAALLSISGCGGGGSDEAAPANAAPTVSISAPAQNASFAAGATITLSATATDSDGSVTKVEFFNGNTKLGEDTSAPFEFSWTNAAPDSTYTITARATDNSGAVAVSASRSISVGAVPNVAPTIAILAPANNFKANVGSTVTWSAQADDSDGTVAGVEFFAINPAAPVFDDTTRLGVGVRQGNTSAYELQTPALAVGTYTVVARATDDDGDIATSASVQVVINALPAISFNAPANGSIFLPGANLTLKATASDADGSIAKVEFFVDGSTTPLGQGTQGLLTSTYDFTWNGVPPGAHTIEARATDNDGATQSVSITIGEDQPPAVALADPVASRPTAPATITLTASASDTDGTIASVTFAVTFNGTTTNYNGVPLGSGSYQLILNNQAAGNYTFTATATDNIGAASTTPSKALTVQPNIAPTVLVTSPASFALPTTLTLTADAADSDGDGIASVQFYVDGVPVGDPDNIEPYAVTWSGPAPGADPDKQYVVTAKAIDNFGSERTSESMTVTVTPDPAGMWSTLNKAQKAGIEEAGINMLGNPVPLTPDRPIGTDGGVHAGAVMTAIGVNTVAPKFVVAMAQGMRKLADLPLAVTGTTLGEAVDCPEGGKIAVFQLAGDDRAIDLIDCKIGGFSFRGGGDFPIDQTYTETAPDNQCTPNGGLPPSVPPAPPLVCTWPSEVKYTQLSADRFRLVVKSVQVSGNGSPEKLNAPFPHNAYGYAWVECTVINGVKSCLTSHENSFLWGRDLAWTGWSDNGTVFGLAPPAQELNLYATDDPYTLNGTMRQCQADPQPENENPAFCRTPGTAPAGYHIKFENMRNTASSNPVGRAIVYGSDGWVVVTRQAPESPGVERVTVQRTVGAVAGPVQPYRCPVDSNGFYQCVLMP